MRVGFGFDVHEFSPDRKLVLGGVTIPHTQGLAGHSDADVVLHAVMDALLGAAGMGDIGIHFPDTDKAYHNADSRMLLRTIWSKIKQSGFAISNLDITVVAQKPKIQTHTSAMKQNIAQDLDISHSRLNIKATTTESLGFIGREEGIAVWAVAALTSENSS